MFCLCVSSPDFRGDQRWSYQVFCAASPPIPWMLEQRQQITLQRSFQHCFIATESQRWHEGFTAWGTYKNSPPPLVLPGAASAQGRQQGCGAARQRWGRAVLGEAGLTAQPSCPLHAEAFEALPNDEHPSCTPLHEQRHIDHMDWGARLVSSIVIFIWKALKSTLKIHPDLWNVVSLLGWKTGFFTGATPCEVKLVNTLQGSGPAEITLHPDSSECR